jgi:glutathione S-transferase
LREALGAADPFVVKGLGKASPRTLATRLVKGSWLRAMNARQRLFDGGQAAVLASTDPLIRFVRDYDPDARAVRKAYEDRVEAPLKRNEELIAKAYFAVYGTGTYPDATFTARLSYGQVKGWREADQEIFPWTTLGGAFEHATGEDPFKLPASWLSAKPSLDLATPFNVATTNDIIGGNSGSPLLDRKARVVGVIFDGNRHSLAGDYAFVPAVNRSISVASTAILEALDKIYGAKALLLELRAGGNPAAGVRK